MPTKETAARPGIAEHREAVEKLAALKAEEAQITETISKEHVAGNSVAALQARRTAVRSEIETIHEAITALRPHVAVEEQAAMRRTLAEKQQLRRENQQRAAEAQAHYNDLMTQADDADRQILIGRVPPMAFSPRP